MQRGTKFYHADPNIMHKPMISLVFNKWKLSYVMVWVYINIQHSFSAKY